ncbi:hypothetical protein RM780_07185 [Streptomyces sp. DSM 44917]|uniref:Uncharacterized protein n=1 Tax=Streptomyces boetiae TaxID=3075541 RepID=A0ABU2L5A8_9ACTN|nr:hypothetical protein [Streptomyces sp. DSM 44917]MDT0306745.1 hypothetical protein [Streptomyces sp. DSM 44917]
MREPTSTTRNEKAPTEGLRQAPARRLLPWPGEDGGPAYLSADSANRDLFTLADELENAQLAAGDAVLRCARPLIAEPSATVRELRFAARRLAECLGDALRVAESRGARLAEESAA